MGSAGLDAQDSALYQQAYLLKALQTNPQDAAVLNDLGRLALLQGEVALAADYLKQAYALKPAEPAIVYNYALCLYRSKAYAEAEGLLKGLIARQPQHHKARFTLGELYRDWGKKDQAKAVWEGLLLDNPSNVAEVIRALEALSSEAH